MSNYIIETQNLSFGYSKLITLEGINLKIEKGSIYGLLGPNGAGKTTIIRLLLGLLQPMDGDVKLFGMSHTDKSLEILKNIGAMIESPSLYEHLSGLDNLEITRRIHKAPRKRIEEVLEIVKLQSASKKRVKNYSLGMKQRLGLALSLISKPQLLILDEPTNGLDPHGIIETRELLSRLTNDFGISILISSHLLSEVEKLVTHIGILTKGKLAFQGTMQELLTLKQQQGILRIQTNNNQSAAIVLKDLFNISVKITDSLELNVNNKEEIAQIAKTLINKGIDVHELHVINTDLEQIFLDITNN